jgi:predicted small metal-binding protein
MTKLYLLDCRDVGVDCDFTAQGASIEEVIEQCAAHGHAEHDMQAFGPAFFAKMRGCVHVVDQEAPETGT